MMFCIDIDFYESSCLISVFFLFYKIGYLVWYWRNIDDGLLINKKVMYWTPDDVHMWLSSMPWTESYRDNFLHNTIGRF